MQLLIDLICFVTAQVSNSNSLIKFKTLTQCTLLVKL